MGCGCSKDGDDTTNGKITNGKVDSFDRRPKISVTVGAKAKRLEVSPTCVFIFGGPGSRKGRIVDDLVNCYGFQFLCVEDIIFQELPKKVANIAKLTNIKEIRKFIEEHPDHVNLSWLLNCVEKRIELDRGMVDTFLIDLIPNFRNLLGAPTDFDNLSSLSEFEQKYPTSFGLNLAIPTNKVVRSVYNVRTQEGESRMKETGGQGDEADVSRMHKRASVYQECAAPFINYMDASQRLVTVDVQCGIADFIWHQVHDVMMELGFHPTSAVNTVVVLGYTDNEIEEINIKKYLMKRTHLRSLVPDPEVEPKALLVELRKHIDEMSEETDAFAISLEGTALAGITKLQLVENQSIITFLTVEEGYLESYLSGCPKTWLPGKGAIKFKAVCTLENEAFLFPMDTDNKVAVEITAQMARTRMVCRSVVSHLSVCGEQPVKLVQDSGAL